MFSHFGHLGDYHGDYAALFIIVMWRIQHTKLYCTCVHKTTRVWCAHTETYGFNMGFL